MVIITIPLHSSPLANSFFKPLLDLSVPRHLTRDCPGISDQDYVRLGLLRTPGAETTGRAFLDTLGAALPQTPARSSFFDASASPRRLQHLRATNEALVRTMTRTMDDPFAAFPELAPSNSSPATATGTPRPPTTPVTTKASNTPPRFCLGSTMRIEMDRSLMIARSSCFRI